MRSAPAVRIIRRSSSSNGISVARPRAADPVRVAIASGPIRGSRVEDLAVLPQVRSVTVTFRIVPVSTSNSSRSPLNVGLGLAAVVDLDDVRLVAVVPQQVEPALEAVRVEQVADDDRQPPALAAVDEALAPRAPGRSRSPAARGLRGT